MQAVIDYLKKNQSRAVAELCEYVRFPSVSAQPQHRGDLRACAEWVVKHCRAIGLEARLCPTQGNPIVVAKTPRVKSPRGHRPHFVGLRPLRRAAAGTARTVEVAALRAARHRRPVALRARRERQQRPEPRAPQGGRGLPQDRDRTALRHHVRHRGRGGGRQQKPRGFLARASRRSCAATRSSSPIRACRLPSIRR